jgi:hypothetical protein
MSDVFRHRSTTQKSYCRTRSDVGSERVNVVKCIRANIKIQYRSKNCHQFDVVNIIVCIIVLCCQYLYKLDIHDSVHHDTIFTKMPNSMQLCRIIYCSLTALHVLSDIFAHHQEHLNCICNFVSSNSPMTPADDIRK